MITSTLIAAGAALAAIVDRVVVQREKIDVLDLGDPEYRGEFVDFPFRYFNRTDRLKGARVEYWLFNEENPAHIVSGKHRTLDLSPIGLNAEYLSFKTEYATPGYWTLAVRITHGDCRWNPLYRLFPLQSTVKKHITLQGGTPNAE